MKFKHVRWSLGIMAVAAMAFLGGVAHGQDDPPEGFRSLFNGEDFTGWVVPEGDGGHWQVIDGVIDYDAQSEAPGEKHLWTEEEFEDFELHIEWRLKETPWVNPSVPIIKPDGTTKLDENGEPITVAIPDSDSGILPRGYPKAQVNIWCWPIGSGEFWGYRTDGDVSDEVRAAVTPKRNADNDIGEWNKFEIRVVDNVVTVHLNGFEVIDEAELPGLPESGPIGIQSHGHMEDGEWQSSPSLIQCRNIFIKELD
ncbi:MAG: DUF1080 domain-containing protein [Candidatus Hydrogenedentota bacterium]